MCVGNVLTFVGRTLTVWKYMMRE